MSRLVVPPKPSRTKKCALRTFKAVRFAARTVAKVPGVVKRAGRDVIDAWQESGGRFRGR